jgi:glycine cleavage system H protein
MGTAEFLASYGAKLLEYQLAIVFLLAFVPFWSYVNGEPRALRRIAPAKARPATGAWFEVPAGVLLHPGHSWARVEADGTVTVGLDDFGHRLFGPVEKVKLPAVGAALAQGAPAATLEAEGKAVAMVSPVEGTVVAVNPSPGVQGDRLARPYASGWLFKAKAPRLSEDAKRLLTGEGARQFVEHAAEALALRLSPEVGRVLQDGGMPVHGIAREISPEQWDELCRSYLLS